MTEALDELVRRVPWEDDPEVAPAWVSDGRPVRARSRSYRRALAAAAHEASGAAPRHLAHDAGAVVNRAVAARRVAMRAEVEVLESALAWAELHPASDLTGAALAPDGLSTEECAAMGQERPDTLAGEGAPLVAEFCVAELALALGTTTDAGRLLVGDALELAHRLPLTWARVLAGDVPAFRARRIAARTRSLCPAAAADVDLAAAPLAHAVGTRLLDELVEAALLRHDPAESLRRAQEAKERRHAHVDLDLHRHDGTVDMDATLDHADALELDAALSHLAHALLEAGSTESHDVRRAQALGMLARGEHPVPLPRDLLADPDAEEWDDAGDSPAPTAATVATTVRRRRMTLFVHLHEAALTATGDVPGHLARVEQGRTPVLADLVRDWWRAPGTTTTVTVRPVIDLPGVVTSGSYEIPAALVEQTAQRDRTCVFPLCARDARRCDGDHVVPHSRGGPTASDNVAPLCRGHHRLKTHHPGWHYRVLHPGSYVWTDPRGRQFLRDPVGTHAL